MEVLRHLAHEIGPRPPCSDPEGRAAEWCAERLRALGLETIVEPFESQPDAARSLGTYLAVSAAGALLLAPLPLVAFVLGVGALVLYARAVDGRPLVAPSGAMSHNVVARAAAPTPPALVVVAGLDSGRMQLSFSRRFPPGPRGWALLAHGALVLMPGAAAAAWVAETTGPLPSTLWVVALALAAILGAAAAMELYGRARLPLLDGANDNASGVETVMRACARFDAPNVWWVLLGSAHAGNVGMQRFLEAHAHELGDARILNVVGVGGGQLTAPGEEGLLRARRSDPLLMDAAVEAGAAMRALRTTQTAAAVAIAHRRPALSIAGLDDRGAIAHQGTEDSLAEVDQASIERAVDLVARVIEVFTGHRDAGRRRRPYVDGTESS